MYGAVNTAVSKPLYGSLVSRVRIPTSPPADPEASFGGLLFSRFRRWFPTGSPVTAPSSSGCSHASLLRTRWLLSAMLLLRLDDARFVLRIWRSPITTSAMIEEPWGRCTVCKRFSICLRAYLPENLSSVQYVRMIQRSHAPADPSGGQSRILTHYGTADWLTKRPGHQRRPGVSLSSDPGWHSNPASRWSGAYPRRTSGRDAWRFR